MTVARVIGEHELAPAPTPPAQGDPWRAELGGAWRWLLVAFGLCTAALGMLVPLSDPDFPLHLATGEWIYTHRAVPFVEPFAWTRAGEPYYAYSWAIQLLYYVTLKAGGPILLHVLHGLLVTAAAAVMFALGRAAGWRPWTTVLMATMNLLFVMALTPQLRPQIVLFILIPLAWALTLRVLDAPRPWRAALGLVAVGAVTANTHLLFALTALPGIAIVTRSPVPWGRGALAMGALAVGWALNPYAASYGAMFVQNFGGNVTLTPPTAILEYLPGFLKVRSFTFVLACLIALVPWALYAVPLTGRERAWYALVWLAGVVSFGVAIRALLVWWLALLPLFGLLVERIPAPETPPLRRARIGLLAALLLCLVGATGAKVAEVRRAGVPEGTVSARTMPATDAAVLEPFAAWLAERAPRRQGRMLTVMMYGGYLTWRLPWLSSSTDGRAIFPDSAAAPDTYRHPLAGPQPYGPWASADVAIVPLAYSVAGVLDTAQGWRRIPVPVRAPNRPPAGLWVREAWLAGGGVRGGRERR